jgi:hypothetical protein
MRAAIGLSPFRRSSESSRLRPNPEPHWNPSMTPHANIWINCFATIQFRRARLATISNSSMLKIPHLRKTAQRTTNHEETHHSCGAAGSVPEPLEDPRDTYRPRYAPVRPPASRKRRRLPSAFPRSAAWPTGHRTPRAFRGAPYPRRPF